MSSTESSSDDLINLEEAANRLGLQPEFVRWALEAGLLLGIKGQYGDWQLSLGDASAGPIPPFTRALGAEEEERPAPAEVPRESEARVAVEAPQFAGPVEGVEAPELFEHPQTPSPGRALEDSRVAEVLREQIQHLQRQLEEQSRSIAEKDKAIAEMAARCVELGSRAISRIPVESPLRGRATGAESDAGHHRAIERHERAINNIRDTLLLVRNYLAQLDASGDKRGQ